MTHPSVVRMACVFGAFLVLPSGSSNSAEARSALVESQRPLSEGIQELAQQISASVVQGKRTRVAVVSFRELQGQPTVLGAYLAEELTTRLYQLARFDVIERTQLDKVMTELKLASTGVIDPDTAKRIGQLAGVDAIVIGTITDFPSSAAVNCRIIDVETAKVIGAASAEFIKDDKLRAIMRNPQPADDPSRPKVVQSGFAFELAGCQVTGPLECRILVTNQAETRQLTIIANQRNHPPSRALSADAEYVAQRVQIAGVQSSLSGSAQASLVRDSPTQILVTFDGVPTSTDRLRILEISAQWWDPRSSSGGITGTLSERLGARGGLAPIRVVFRNVPVQRR